MRAPLFSFVLALAGFIIGVVLTAIMFILLARMPNSQLLVAILSPTPTFTPTSTATPTAIIIPTATQTQPPTMTLPPSITPSPTLIPNRLSSLHNPVPVNTEFPLYIDKTKDFTVTLIGSRGGQFAIDEVKAYDGFLPSMSDDMELLLVTVGIKYDSGPDGVPLGIVADDFNCISDGKIMPNPLARGPKPFNGNILPGTYSEGILVKIAYKDDLEPLLGFSMGHTADGSAGFFFATR